MRCRFGLFEFDTRTGDLRREGQPVKLAPQPARVLALLVERAGEIVLREHLRAHLWGGDTFVDFERGLNFCILQVRTALGDAADRPRFVQTLPRKGYRFIAPVAAIEPAARDTATPAPPVATPPPTPASRPATAVRHHAIAAAVAALVILAPVAWLALAARPTPADDAAPIRVAVLPVANLTGDATFDYLADGLTDQMIAELGRLGPARLAVIARTSVMAFRGSAKTVIEIARELDAAYVIEGSIRRDGGGLSVQANLATARDHTVLRGWSDEYTGDGTVAIRLARHAALALVSTAPALTPSTTNAEAWDAYLRGRLALVRGGREPVTDAIAHFERAVQQDPSFAAGWAQLAEAWHAMVMSAGAPPREAYPAAAAAAARALALDDRLADAHLARGLVQLWYEWNPIEAGRSFERALARNGSHAAAHHDYAWALIAQGGRDDQAIHHITRARDLDPLSARANTDIGWLFLYLRRPADAVRACRHTLAIDPRSLEAQACLDLAARRQRGIDDGTRAAARARLDALRRTAATQWVSPYSMAVQALLIDDRSTALDHLEAAVADRVAMMVLLPRDPAVDAVRGDARFAALLPRVSGSAAPAVP